MRNISVTICVMVIGLCLINSPVVLAECPSADLTGDCFVDYEDFALMGGQWLNGYDCNDLTEMASQWLTGNPNIPDDMTYILGGEFEMGDHFEEGGSGELPVHAVLVDSFFMSKFEITNQQYCDYLNSALGSGSIYLSSNIVYGTGNNQGYCDTSASSTFSQIDYSGGAFSARTKDGRDMSDDPMVLVSWYGAVAYCNWRSSEEGYESCYNLSTWECNFSKNGYRLATEAEWEYAARGGEHDPYYRYPWGDSIDPNQANYLSSGDPYETGTWPYTTPVGFFDGQLHYKIDFGWPGSQNNYQTSDGSNGYGLYDMAGNVFEWCNDWWDLDYYDTSPYDNPTGPASGTYRVLHGGCHCVLTNHCRVSYRFNVAPDGRLDYIGFRVCR